jgi:hypothetical protein
MIVEIRLMASRMESVIEGIDLALSVSVPVGR